MQKPPSPPLWSWLLVALAPLATGCVTNASHQSVARQLRCPGPNCPVGGDPAVAFATAIAAARKLDTSTPKGRADCQEVIGRFVLEKVPHELEATALYDAGAVADRCGMHTDAEAYFTQALSRDPSAHFARAELALEMYDAKEADVDHAIGQLTLAVHDSEYRNARALVGLARLQRTRANDTADDDGPNDLARAEKNLKRALAVDDSSVGAMNELALLYYTTAKGSKERLDLALLVASQAKKKDPSFAPTYNTLGLIDVALGDSTSAAEAFDRARKLDPTFVEAQMNFASVNLAFRGFAAAESAYREVLKARPNDYDAHLGLALALRGQIGDENFEHQIALAERELVMAKEADPKRPEAYFNEAILTAEYKAKLPGQESALALAKKLYGEFVQHARGNAAFDAQIEDVTAVSTKSDAECMRPGAKDAQGCKKGRIQNIDEMIEFTRGPRPRG